ncbi:Era-like GTP-binding protein [Synechococcus sp. PCC 6312]|uniref:Era-like GTP-binding protein n=1 Tax=Synechococcus sp. (strain ATCC 27167 / PCC 6312) TaxID=195253 RepID=UPI00029ED53F|nr:Era-like GTP-binding protein [Synechococcus sp. PCC 6312]AFY59644.1 small GTP-binding protein domain protein [Synechococcus sp. PCC 6312]
MTEPLDCSARVQACLQHLIAWHQHHHPAQEIIWSELVALEEKLAYPVWQIAVLGQVSRGKSALINALLGQPQFPTGPTHGITLWPHSVRWQVELAGQTYAIDLTDTPGLDEFAGEQRAAMAWEVAQQADLVLFVTAGPLNPVEINALKKLQELQVSLLFVANKQDLYLAWSKVDIDLQLQQAGLAQFITLDQVLLVSAAPVAETGRELLTPNIQPLSLALTTWLTETAPKSRAQQVLQQTLSIEQHLGTTLLDQPQPTLRTVWFIPLAGLGMVLLPWGLGDMVLGLGSSFGLARWLCRFYGIPLTPPASGQAWQIILISTLGIGLLGQSGWAWMLGELSWGVSVWVGGIASQVGVWAWGLSRLQQIIRTHVQQGYHGGSQGPGVLLKELEAIQN